MLDTNMDRIETPAERNARYNAEHHARLRELTRLEQAAYKERKHLGAGFDPYTEQERTEAERIRAEIERLAKCADMLNQKITRRLERQAETNAPAEALRKRFATMGTVRIDLQPF